MLQRVCSVLIFQVNRQRPISPGKPPSSIVTYHHLLLDVPQLIVPHGSRVVRAHEHRFHASFGVAHDYHAAVGMMFIASTYPSHHVFVIEVVLLIAIREITAHVQQLVDNPLHTRARIFSSNSVVIAKEKTRVTLFSSSAGAHV